MSGGRGDRGDRGDLGDGGGRGGPGSGGLALGFYRVLLRLLPAELRSRHGAEMAETFADRLWEARTDRGRWAAGLAVMGGYWDVVRRAAYERGRREVPSPGAWSNLGSDLRFAFRTFGRRPGITLVAVVMLSLGIAASGAVFTLADGVFLRPLPYPEPDRLVYLDETAPAWNLEYTGIRYYDFALWREGQRTFDAMALIDQGSYNLAAGDGAERVIGARVTHDLPDVLGIVPVVGRTFTVEEDQPGAAPVVMLGTELWRSRFGGSRDVVGETVRLNSRPYTVVGVLPPEGRLGGPVQLWTPMALDPTVQAGFSFQGVGRLKEGVTVATAEEDLRRVHQAVWEEDEELRGVSPVVEPLRANMTAEIGGAVWAMAIAVGLVLLIACANVAAILLARSFARRRELGVRIALGAGSRRIGRQLLAESLALALVAAPLGLVLGFATVRAVALGLPEGLPPWIVLEPSWRMALFGLAVVMATTLLFGWAPVLQARRTPVRETLAEGGGRAGASRGQRRTMNGLVIAEITLAALLLVSGGLLLRAFQSLQDTDPGYRTENVLSFRVALPETTYPDSLSRGNFYSRLLADLDALPAVRAVGAIDCPPLSCHSGSFFAAEGGLGTDPDDANPVVLYRLATTGYFEAMGIEPVMGRLLEPDDQRPGRQNVAVINETFARTFFPGVENPVGRRLENRGQTFDEDSWRVVGVSRDVKHYGVDEEMRPALYFPYSSSRASMAVFLWTETEPTALAGDARRVVGRLDPELPLFQVATTDQALQESLTMRRATTWSMMMFAALALMLALGGIYGVLSYVVGQRSREMGIRVALGASRGGILRLVLRHGLTLAGVGTVLGFAAALAAGRAMEGLLVGFSALDPVTYGAAAAVLVGAALAASWVPAWRAVSVEAGAALRDE